MSNHSQTEICAPEDVDISDECAAPMLNDLIYVFCEDSDAARQLAGSLALHNHEVESFSDLEEFRAAILIRAPQAVVLDIDTEAGQRARQVLAHRGATAFPVIYISSEDLFFQRLEAVREGAEGYFIKPVDVADLSARIDRQISKNAVLGYRILVVDDDELQAAYYDAVLSSAGMHVLSISDPVEVLDAIKKFKPELILTDLIMPVCNGIEMAKIIRQNNRYLNVPIVFLSIETATQQQNSAIESGADDFLTKPIDPEKLISAVVHRAERYRCLRRQS